MPTADNLDRRRCLNCGASLAGKYCHACGQDSSRGRLVARELLSGFFGALLSLDSRYTRTFGGLVRAPGTVSKRYVEGKRRSNSNPVTYFVAAMTINLLVPLLLSAWLVNDQQGPIWLTSSVAAPLGLTLFLPIAALWKWLFRNSGWNLAENYVFTLYLFGQLLLYEAMLTPLFPLIGENWVLAILSVIFVAMFVFGGAQFYAMKKSVVVLKFVISMAIGFVVLSIVAIAVDWLVPGLIE